eukprot:CAMPEP_0173382422 /NCGR_PEP_ID=MMETSP1356-20130122/4925_1 /TAXON_ID=77927 ORGANISM="Hemiselmis virescens, Strain PCC157" /NCGR_SAMPLE_ID=MMETSP1356 /ASSEMBLY_ACC=CAM_ASM_000847 /LENGTH=274 /DNA_ID=CAMNT_0014336751 /DNA_START=56 /DNA_END=877 /DNA_ORIENTATION=+
MQFTVDDSQILAEFNKELGALSEEDKKFATDHTLRRYLKARKNNVHKASKLLRETLEWRRSFAVKSIRGEDVAEAGPKGKLFTMGCDVKGRPTLFMRPAFDTCKDAHDLNVKHLVYNMERAVSYMDEANHIGKMVVVLDCLNYSSSTSPPFKTSKATLTILQDHYPERLGKFLILSAPWYFHMFFKAISPFIDPETKEKIEFVTAKDTPGIRAELEKHFVMSSFPQFLYGDLSPEEAFNKDTYYTAEGEARGADLVKRLREEQAKTNPQTNESI